MSDHEEQLAARLRPRLEEELRELAALLEQSSAEAAPVTLDQQSVGRIARMDAMQMQAMAQENERRRKLRRARLIAALARIDNGDFGYCLDCGEPIGEGRLSVDPTFPTCVACAT